MSSFGKFVFGAVVGGAVGAFVGMLFAPRSGEETRRLIREDMEARCSEQVENVKEAAREKVDAIKEKVEEVGETLKDSADNLKDKAKELSEELEETGRKTMTQIQSQKPSKA